MYLVMLYCREAYWGRKADTGHPEGFRSASNCGTGLRIRYDTDLLLNFFYKFGMSFLKFFIKGN